MSYNVISEFGKQSKKFRLYFGLAQNELAALSGMSQSEYNSLENGTINYYPQKLQNVASVYGLHYYELGNPVCKFPKYSSLPNKTKTAIETRKAPLKKYDDRLIIEHLILFFKDQQEGSDFLIKEIVDYIHKKFHIYYENEEVSGTISKNFKEYIFKTNQQDFTKKGRGAKPFYYKLIQKISKEMVYEAERKIDSSMGKPND